MSRGAMSFGGTTYGGVHFSTMQGDEPGYATGNGEVKLHSITLPPEAVALIGAGKAVRICEDGIVLALDGEPAGLIVFGNYKGDRPVLGGE
jgi:hypothetical protein